MKVKVIHVVGARPNFIKVAPIMAEMACRPDEFEQVLVHTGQHYDANMSGVFFRDLELPEPDVYLGVGSGSHAEQTARVMMAFEPVVKAQRPDWVIVVGDVNSTLAAALVCAKLGVPLVHVEAGLRSFDRSMPEEINRILTDQLADLLFTTEPNGDENLCREGIPLERIRFVGNIMIDSLVRFLPKARLSPVLKSLNLAPGSYAVATLHRPSNVDNQTTLSEILLAFNTLAADLPIIFPIHPRTRERLHCLGHIGLHPGIQLIEPQGYIDFLQLYSNARFVLTDSGGLQEETTYLGIPCLTLRPNTERPVTITVGTNRLISSESDAIIGAARDILHAVGTRSGIPDLWDGRAAKRIADTLVVQQLRHTKLT